MDNEKREKRAMSIAAMGLVRREDDKFIVSTPSLRGKQTSYKVSRNELRKVVCTCLEFKENYPQIADFRCEHILAVKFHLSNPTEKPETKSQKLPLENGREHHCAVSLMDLVTAKQLGMMRAISREIVIDNDTECEKMMDCKTDELCKKLASLFIQHLQDLESQQPVKSAF